ncbi:MAG: chromate efflux transporter [Ilumatobacteraceae bacterium]
MSQPAPGGEIATPPGLGTVLREWGRLGCIGFGGPPTHIKLLRELCVERHQWLDPQEFEDAIAACNLLPGPASTQLAIFSAWRVRGRAGAIVGGLAFIIPGLTMILALSALFLEGSPPRWVLGVGAGAGAAVAAVAAHAATTLVQPSWTRHPDHHRWIAYVLAGAAASALLGPWVAVVLIACGLIELAGRNLAPRQSTARSASAIPILATATLTLGTLAQVAWVALKVGALSYGGGFVIVPLMQHDAVDTHQWLTAGQFLNAVALGQITPGPVVHTVAAVGYGAGGLATGLLAASVAFTPSFGFVLLGARHFGRLRRNERAAAFLGGAGPAAIGAIFGATIPLTRALSERWQYAVLAAAAVTLLVLRRGTVLTLLTAGSVGVVVALAGGPLPR